MQYVAGEPPERTAARARRLAETRQKMAAASAEMAARDSAANQEAADKVDLREQLKPRMEAWHKGKQVRGCLAQILNIYGWVESLCRPELRICVSFCFCRRTSS